MRLESFSLTKSTMRAVLILAQLVLFLPALSFAKNEVWGTIIKVDKKIHNITSPYYITFKDGDVTQAYPIDPRSEEMKKLVLENVDKRVLIEGDVETLELKSDGGAKRALMFVPRSIKPLTLRELSVTDVSGFTPREKTFTKTETSYNGGGISISDKAANAMVFTGAALMLGNAILRSGPLKKR